MISLILPYWERQEAADKALGLLHAAYRDLPDFEVVIVDDGSATPFRAPDISPPLTIVRLADKSGPKSPVTPWNEGVKAARGDVIALSCIEVLHEKPVLAEMLDELARMGPDGYVLAAAWCPEQDAWHCHTSVEVPRCPKGSGLSFCGMLHRDLYERAGGFDEDYRDGAGYEDRDFINRLHKVGAVFMVRDDLVVTHPKTGASIQWGAEKFLRNADLFDRKWPPAAVKPITVVCLKAGTAFGPEYVNNLHDMVRRNLPDGYPGRFVCLTDDAEGLDEGIETLPLPGDLETWWGKLYFFKRGLFKDGERVAFFDLDTLVIGDLSQILSYDGDFATLSDFYYPERVGPAVMLWRAGGPATAIWDAWEAAGKPRNPMGDLWWINQLESGWFAQTCDRLQEIVPNQIVSYKVHCAPLPPKGATVVCFHGYPKAHNCGAEWVANVWRVGGQTAAALTAYSNTEYDRVAANVKHACALDAPWLPIVPEHDGDAVIVGGGPSMTKALNEIAWRVKNGAKVFALNGAFAYLKGWQINPDYHVIIDAKPENVAFIDRDAPTHYLLSSQCDTALFDAVAGASLTVVHMNTQGMATLLPKGREANLISTGTTVGLAALGIAFVLGYRNLHLYGFDSSYADAHHAYPQPWNDADRVIEAEVSGRKFKCAPWMVMQAQQFQTIATELANAGCTITVNGDGLLPLVAKEMGRQFAGIPAFQPEPEMEAAA